MMRIATALAITWTYLTPLAATGLAQQPPTPAQTQAVCMELYQPVCGTKEREQVTYANRCFAKIDRASHITDGPCGAPK
jgi:hypothetical protein